MLFKKIIYSSGFSSFKSFGILYVLPLFLGFLFSLFISIILFEDTIVRAIGIIVSFLILGLGCLYPILNNEKDKRSYDELLPFFITYAGALSTVQIPRKDFFKDLSKKKEYFEISNVFKKINYLTEKIKLDFSSACYKIANIISAKGFSEFIERMGISLYFNSKNSDFFLGEQNSLMANYSSYYKESLERLRTIQEIFSSLILSLAYVLGIIFLVPFISGLDIAQFLKYSILGVIFMNLILIFLIKSALPEDNLYTDVSDVSDIEFSKNYVMVGAIVSMIFFLVFQLTNLSFLVAVSISLLPLLYVGIKIKQRENVVKKKDFLFTSFIRSVGEIHFSKGGTLVSTLETLIIHNFGEINNDIRKAYKRLKISMNSTKPWELFSKEIGSNLIQRFTDIFVSSVRRGGNSKDIGSICSRNMEKIIGLRNIKKEYFKTFRGSIYSGFFGLNLTIFLCLQISMLLTDKIFSITQGVDGEGQSMISNIFFLDSVNFELIEYLIYILIIVQSFLSAYLIKEVDGGNKYGLVLHFTLLVWLATILEVAISYTFKMVVG